jgi:hypothetical protein
MSTRTEAIAAELRRIRDSSSEDIGVLIMPLISAVEHSWAEWEQGAEGVQLASMANSLAQVAAQSGDMETAVAIASLQVDIESLTADERASAAQRQHDATYSLDTSAAESDSDAEPAGESLRGLVGPAAKLLALLGICALTYGGYEVIDGHLRAASPATGAADVGAPRPAEALEPDSGSDQGQPIALWWMGTDPHDQALGRRPESATIAAAQSRSNTEQEANAHARAAAPRRVGDAATPSGTAKWPAPAEPGRQKEYRLFVDQEVTLTDASGTRYQGLLTAVSANGVTLRTEVLMFGEPIVAHRLFPFSTITDLRSD